MSARLTLAILFLLPGMAQAQVAGLKHNPFARPVPATAAAGIAAPASAVAAPAAAWKPELRAILAAGARSMVNVEGTVIPVGEHFEGHRLVEVHETSAVFVNGSRKRVTLSLRGIEPLPPGTTVGK